MGGGVTLVRTGTCYICISSPLSKTVHFLNQKKFTLYVIYKTKGLPTP